MIWASIVILYLTLIRMVVALSNLVYSPLPISPAVGSAPLVSVLIPARNEEQSIGRLLDSLLKQTYALFEIIIYNDASTDGTRAILQRYSETDSRIRYIEGGELPEGWLGKNHACHRLAEEAVGEFLLFIDADVIAGGELISSGVVRMKKQRLSLLSVFPYQIMEKRGERIVVPVMNWILLSLLPLALVRYCKWSSFSAANGQFMMFRTSVYKRYWFHQLVKNRVTEDILIARLMKRERLRIQTLASRGLDVSCKMYDGYSDAVNGFSKNVITMFGGSYFFIGFFVLVSLFGWLPVYLGMGWYGLGVYIMMALIINISVAAASGQDIVDSLLLFPERMIAFLRIVYRALLVRKRNYYHWKGRSINQIK